MVVWTAPFILACQISAFGSTLFEASRRAETSEGGSLESELKLMGAVNGPLKQTQTLPAILPENRNSLLSGGHRVCRWLITSLDVSTHF